MRKYTANFFLFIFCLLSSTELSTDLCQAQGYKFQRVFNTGTRYDSFSLRVPTLNNLGQVAFQVNEAETGKGSLFLWTAGVRVPVATTDTQFSRFGRVQLNDIGQIGFEASNENGEGIYLRKLLSTVTIAETIPDGDFDFVNVGPSVNLFGDVAFIGERIEAGNYVDGVWVGNGRTLAAAFSTKRIFSDFTGNPAINLFGNVAFLATKSNGEEGLYYGRGRNLVTVATSAGELCSVFSFSDPSVNIFGQVAFKAGINPQEPDDNGAATGEAVYLYSNNRLEKLVEVRLANNFLGFQTPALNNAGEVAFVVDSFGDQQIIQTLVAGTDLVDDRVLRVGNRLFGKTVASIVLGRSGFNDFGQLAFLVYFDDGTASVVLASKK